MPGGRYVIACYSQSLRQNTTVEQKTWKSVREILVNVVSHRGQTMLVDRIQLHLNDTVVAYYLSMSSQASVNYQTPNTSHTCLLLRRRTSPPTGWYSSPVPLRGGGCVGVSCSLQNTQQYSCQCKWEAITEQFSRHSTIQYNFKLHLTTGVYCNCMQDNWASLATIL